MNGGELEIAPWLHFFGESEQFSWQTPARAISLEIVKKPEKTKLRTRRKRGQPRVRFSRQWNSFQHYKRWSDPYPGVSQVIPMQSVTIGWPFDEPGITWGATHLYGLWSKNWYYTFGDLDYPTEGIPDLLAYVDPEYRDFSIPLPDNLDEMMLRAQFAFNPTIKKELSLINSIIELKDFVTLRSTMQRIKDAIVNIRSGVPGQTLRSIFKAGADGWLQAQFNILPLISDIRSVMTVLASVDKRVNSFLADGRARTLRYTEEIPIANTDHVGEAFMPASATPSWGAEHYVAAQIIPKRVTTSEAVFHAQIQYRLVYSEDQRENALLYSKLDALGVDLNPAIIWNAIPWSFVVDWFVNVSKLLDQTAMKFMEPRIDILQYCWSIRTSRVFSLSLEVRHEVDDSGTIGSVTRYQYPLLREVAYRRDTTMPDASWFLTSGLSLTEFSLASSLAVSRLKRFTRLSTVLKRRRRRSLASRRWRRLFRLKGGTHAR
jgi:hypothetical protein